MPAAHRNQVVRCEEKDGSDGYEKSRGKGIFLLTVLNSDALNGSVASQTSLEVDVFEQFRSNRIRLLRTLEAEERTGAVECCFCVQKR